MTCHCHLGNLGRLYSGGSSAPKPFLAALADLRRDFVLGCSFSNRSSWLRGCVNSGECIACSPSFTDRRDRTGILAAANFWQKTRIGSGMKFRAQVGLGLLIYSFKVARRPGLGLGLLLHKLKAQARMGLGLGVGPQARAYLVKARARPEPKPEVYSPSPA
jgi:hypothetical protein